MRKHAKKLALARETLTHFADASEAQGALLAPPTFLITCGCDTELECPETYNCPGSAAACNSFRTVCALCILA